MLYMPFVFDIAHLLYVWIVGWSVQSHTPEFGISYL